MSKSLALAVHPVLLARTFALQHPDLPQAGFCYIQIVSRLRPASRLKLVEIAQELHHEGVLNPLISSQQVLAQVKLAVASATQNKSYLCPPNLGGDAAAMAVIIILMLVQDGDQDLQQQMAAAQAQIAAKQALRDLLNYLDQIQAGLASGSYSSAGYLSSVGYAAAVARIPWLRKL